jgi:predicted ArsR family transcriptional regulator
MTRLPNQRQKVLEYLSSGKALTREQAMTELGIMNVTARIAELRNEGYVIEPNIKSHTNRYGDKVSSATWTMDTKHRTYKQMELQYE